MFTSNIVCSGFFLKAVTLCLTFGVGIAFIYTCCMFQKMEYVFYQTKNHALLLNKNTDFLCQANLAFYQGEFSWLAKLKKKNKVLFNKLMKSLNWLNNLQNKQILNILLSIYLKFQNFFYSLKNNLAFERKFKKAFSTKVFCINSKHEQTPSYSNDGKGGGHMPESSLKKENFAAQLRKSLLFQNSKLFKTKPSVLKKHLDQKALIEMFSWNTPSKKYYGLAQAINCAVLFLFNKKAVLNTESYLMFVMFIKWLYNAQLGFNLEMLLNRVLQKSQNLILFETYFLSFQKNNSSFFFSDQPVNNNSLKLLKVIFDKTNLLKIIRLLMLNYNSTYWNSLTPKQQFLLSQKLVCATRASGSYIYINQLFKKITPNSTIQFNNKIFSFSFSENNPSSEQNIQLDPNLSLQAQQNSDNPLFMYGVLQDRFFHQSSQETKVIKLFQYGSIFFGLAGILFAYFASSKTQQSYHNTGAPNMVTILERTRHLPPLCTITKVRNLNTQAALDLASSETPTNLVATNFQSKNGALPLKATRQLALMYVPPIDDLLEKTQSFKQPVYFTGFSPTGQFFARKINTTVKVTQGKKTVAQTNYLAAEYIDNNTGENLIQSIYKETCLGFNSTDTANTENRTVSSSTDLVIVDPALNKAIEWTIPFLYNELGILQTHMLAKLSSHYAHVLEWSTQKHILDKESLKVLKEIENFPLYQKLKQVCEKRENVNIPKMKVIEKYLRGLPPSVKKCICTAQNTQGAHVFSEKQCESLGLSHKNAPAIHTHKLFNLPYDDQSANTHDVPEWSVMERALLRVTYGAELCAEKFYEERTLLASQQSNLPALAILQSVNRDRYATLAESICNAFTDQSISIYRNIPNLSTQLLSKLKHSYGHNKLMLKTCANNFQIVANTSAGMAKTFSNLTLTFNNIQDILSNDLNIPKGFYDTVDREISSFLYEHSAGIKSLRVYQQFALYQALNHSLVTNKNFVQMQAFLEKALTYSTMRSTGLLDPEFSLPGLNSLPVDFVRALDKQFLSQYRSLGNQIHHAYDLISNNLHDSIYTLDTCALQFVGALESAKTPEEIEKLTNLKDFLLVQRTILAGKLNELNNAWIPKESVTSRAGHSPDPNQLVGNNTVLQMVRHVFPENALNYESMVQTIRELNCTPNNTNTLLSKFNTQYSKITGNAHYQELLQDAKEITWNSMASNSIIGKGKKSNTVSPNTTGYASDSEVNSKQKPARKPARVTIAVKPQVNYNETMMNVITHGSRSLRLGSEPSQLLPEGSSRASRMVSTDNQYSQTPLESQVARLALPASASDENEATHGTQKQIPTRRRGRPPLNRSRNE